MGSDKSIQFQNVRILLAEDNPVNQIVALGMLKKYGCHVTPAADGSETLKHFQGQAFDLILMDCQMPVMDGYEATQAIRKLEATQQEHHTPIIAFSANTTKIDYEKCLKSGMDGCISKPIETADLERTLITWLPPEKRLTAAS